MSIHDRDLLTGKTKLETSIERIRTFCTGRGSSSHSAEARRNFA